MKISNKFYLIGLSCIFWLIPLPYGGVEEWTIFALESATIVLFIIFLFLQVASNRRSAQSAYQDHLPSRAPLANPVLERSGRKKRVESKIIYTLILIFFAINLLQITPLPASVVKLFSPQKYHLLAKALALTADAGTSSAAPASLPSFFPLSLAPALSSYELLKYICFFLFAFMLYHSLHSRREIQFLVLVLISAGIFQAVYGLMEYLGGTGRIFGYKNIWGQGSAFGTFINRDHFAGFLEMIFPLSLGFLLARSNFFALKKGVSWRQKIIWFGQERLQQAILFGTLSVVIGLGLFFSRSRSGVIIFFLTFFLMMLAVSLGAREAQGVKGGGSQGLEQIKREGREDRKNRGDGKEEKEKKDRKDGKEGETSRRGAGQNPGSPYSSGSPGLPGSSGSRRWLRVIRTVTLAVIFVAIFIGIRPIIERFTLESFWREARPRFYKLTLRMVADYPLFGTGAGTYIYAYTPYEDKDLGGILHHAHNDYLEILAEMGIIGGGAIIGAAFLALVVLFWRWAKLPEHDYFRRGVGLGLIGGIVAILIHSFSDFNLRVPANALYFISFYVLAWRLLVARIDEP